MKIYISPKESAKKESLIRILEKYGITADFVEIPLELFKKDSANKIKQIKSYINSLNEISKINFENLELSLKIILELAVKASGISRAGYWMWSKDTNELICIDLFIKEPPQHRYNEKINISYNPKLAKIINKGEILKYVDITKEDVITEFTDNYFLKNNIRSIFYIPIIKKEKIIGFLFYENVGEIKNWDYEDELFLTAIASYISVIIEINEKIQLEEIKQKNLDLFKTIFDNISEGVIIGDSNETFILANPAAEKIFGFPPGGLIGRNFKDFIEPEHLKTLLQQTEERKKGKTNVYELEIKKFGGEKRIISISASPRYDKNGNYAGAFGMISDITEKKLLEEELRNSKAKAEEMNRLKSNILSNISHEFRTPLNSILGLSEYMIENIKQEDLLDFAKQIHSSGNRLLQTINQVLDLSRIESNKFDLNIEKINIDEIVEHLKSIYSPVAQEKNIKFNINVKYPVDLICDKSMLKSVLNNFVNNAVKYTHHGEVLIEIKNITTETGKYVHFKVSDTGIGIAENSKKQIFEAFRQASEGWGRKYEGLGLGLTIARKYLNYLKGYLDFESKENQGTTFNIYIPSVYNEEIITSIKEFPPDIKEKPKEKKLRKILYVEDDYNCQLLVKILLRDKFSVDIAKNLNDALSLIAINNYDLILLDINLGGGETGLDLLKTLKRNTKYETTPVIALTAYALKEERDAILKAGCIEHVSKPFEKETLLNVIFRVMEKINS
ncbi:MAG: ATP-binding protein [Ignavibacteria bacterium]|nr:ATP-binding protein [Ignavibacteria bacterium]